MRCTKVHGGHNVLVLSYSNNVYCSSTKKGIVQNNVCCSSTERGIVHLTCFRKDYTPIINTEYGIMVYEILQIFGTLLTIALNRNIK